MTSGRIVKSLLKRGALLAGANWQVVLIQLAGDTLLQMLLLVPVVGGAALMVLVIGVEPSELLALDARRIIPAVAAVLAAQPMALAAFLAAIALVLAGGSVLMFFLKGGTVATLVEADRLAGPIERPPLSADAIVRASHVSIEGFVAGARRLFPRFLRLGLALGVVYAASIAAWLAVLLGLSGDSALPTLAAAGASMGLVTWITAVNLLYLLLQIVMAADDCGLGAAIPRVAGLLAREPATVGAIFAAVLALVVLTTAASVLATAALGLIAFVPFVGLAALPLQLLAWLIRGVVFQFIGLASVVAYLQAYRLARGAAVVPSDEPVRPFGHPA